jgi:hypothetical protein
VESYVSKVKPKSNVGKTKLKIGVVIRPGCERNAASPLPTVQLTVPNFFFFYLLSGHGPREAGERTQRKGSTKQGHADKEGRRPGVKKKKKFKLFFDVELFDGQVLLLFYSLFLWHEMLRLACKEKFR